VRPNEEVLPTAFLEWPTYKHTERKAVLHFDKSFSWLPNIWFLKMYFGILLPVTSICNTYLFFTVHKSEEAAGEEP